ncbi:hypothetical protein [Chitinophaga sp.]|uniref:hypothetical protein n=1 Tax=Chitinophaga sp. TaxID=1869181 RepID=UPI00263463DC|nr:hypothetical protein [uncultured Chitinophaga sp.]
MRKGLLLLLAGFILVNLSCKKDEQIEPLGDTLVMDETLCDTPWSQDLDRSSANFNVELENWLEAKTGIAISQPLRKSVPGKAQACLECGCRTGNVIYIWPPNGKQQKFIAMGFKKGG